MIVINLIPEKEKKDVTKHYLFLLYKDVVMSFLVVSAILSIFFVASSYILNENFIDLATRNFLTNPGKTSTLSEVRYINKKLDNILEIQQENTNWIALIEKINKQIPHEEIEIASLDFRKSEKTININGKALNRKAFLNFKNNLENLEEFKKIESPLSNILAAENFDFRLIINWDKSNGM